MLRLSRWPGSLLIVALTLTIGLLPPWEICIHSDGRACGETKDVCCGGGETTDPAAPCPDCLDLAPVAVGLTAAPQPVTPPQLIPGALFEPAAPLPTLELVLAGAPADRPPPSLDPPPISLHLRC